MTATLRCGRYSLDLSRPRVMGILNVTPDSFSDGGSYIDRGRALDHARRMWDDGADLIDIGGESTRPGAVPVSDDEELSRVLPIVEALAREGVAVAVDTRKPAVMRASIAAGAAMINDVAALCATGAIEACTDDVGVCIMHMRGGPENMQEQPVYADVVSEVRDFLGASGSPSTRALASARRWRIISRSCARSALSPRRATRCLPGCRGSPRSARSPDAASTSVCPRASRRCSSLWRGAHRSSECTTYGRPSTR